MTERTYGSLGFTLKQLEGGHPWDATVAMAAHIRELQAELAELKLQHLATLSQATELQAENAKLKAEYHKLASEADKFQDGFDWVQRAMQAEIQIELFNAERREFAHGCVRASRDAVTCRLIVARGRGENFWDAALSVDMLAIVEQELAK